MQNKWYASLKGISLLRLTIRELEEWTYLILELREVFEANVVYDVPEKQAQTIMLKPPYESLKHLCLIIKARWASNDQIQIKVKITPW